MLPFLTREQFATQCATSLGVTPATANIITTFVYGTGGTTNSLMFSPLPLFSPVLLFNPVALSNLNNLLVNALMPFKGEATTTPTAAADNAARVEEGLRRETEELRAILEAERERREQATRELEAERERREHATRELEQNQAQIGRRLEQLMLMTEKRSSRSYRSGSHRSCSSTASANLPSEVGPVINDEELVLSRPASPTPSHLSSESVVVICEEKKEETHLTGIEEGSGSWEAVESARTESNASQSSITSEMKVWAAAGYYVNRSRSNSSKSDISR